MKRSLFFCVLSFLVGIYAAHLLAGAFDVYSVAFWFSACFLALLFTKRARIPFCLLSCFILGAVLLNVRADVNFRPLSRFLGEYVTIRAEIIETPEAYPEQNYVSALARIRHVRFLEEEKEINETVKLSFRYYDTVPAFRDEIEAICFFSVPKTPKREGKFDENLYLKTNNIFFEGAVESGTVNVIGKYRPSFRERLYIIRERFREHMFRLFPNDTAAVLSALSSGSQSGIGDGLYEKLKVSGLAHVVAVSGMHVGALTTLLYLLYALLRRNRNRVVFITGLFLLSFMLFTGSSPSVVRATVMCLLGLLAYHICRKEDGLTSLSLSAFLLLIYNPYLAFSWSFMLSFAATLGILLFTEPLNRTLLAGFCLYKKEGFFYSVLKGILSIFSVTVGAQALLLPLSAELFGSVSLWSFLTNILVAPLAPLLLIAGLLAGFCSFLSPPLAYFVTLPFYPFIRLFMWIVEFFGTKEALHIPLSSFSVYALYMYAIFLYGFYCVLTIKGKKQNAYLVEESETICR